MTLYRIIVYFIKYLVLLLNGRPIVLGKENLPTKASILAATHRSWLDPVYLSTMALPLEIAYIAKHTLFESKFTNFLFPRMHGIPINRDKPSPKTLRAASDAMNKQGLHLGIFATGSRYSTEIKSGTAFIQKLSKADIIPIAIQPPANFGQFLLRRKARIAIGKPIAYNPELSYNREELSLIDEKIGQAFQELDQLLDPNYVYIPKIKNKKA